MRQNIATKFASFLAHHSHDLRTLASTLATIADELPMNHGTRANVDKGLAALLAASASIDASVGLVRELAAEPVVEPVPVNKSIAAPESLVKEPGPDTLDMRPGDKPRNVDAPIPPTANTGADVRSEERFDSADATVSKPEADVKTATAAKGK